MKRFIARLLALEYVGWLRVIAEHGDIEFGVFDGHARVSRSAPGDIEFGVFDGHARVWGEAPVACEAPDTWTSEIPDDSTALDIPDPDAPDPDLGQPAASAVEPPDGSWGRSQEPRRPRPPPPACGGLSARLWEP